MASTSINLDQKKYDAFISFRGADIRDGFLSHFYQALSRKQIHTFMDEKLERGEEISPALLRNIEESNVSIVIFSENFAYSPWCLDELVKVVECKKSMGQIVLPVFYQVDPTHVQELTGTYGDAFVKHLIDFKHCLDKVETWTNALMETANISGWDSRVIKPESKLIEEIVNHILKKLSCISPVDFNDGLVGIEQRAKEVESLLCIGSTNVCSVGIWGMGGIGKTTIAGTVFKKIFSQFEGQCFLANAREELEKRTPIHVRDEILSKVLGEENLNIGTPNIPIIIRNKLQRKKVLIVLDDVISSLQLKFLMGEHDSYGPGSKIIITSRDKQVLKNGCSKIYEVQKLSDDEAFQLFKLHAFKQNDPRGKYLELSKSAANYAKGIPLALKVLGSNLYEKGAKEWESELAELEVAPNVEVGKILRISYENLDRNEKSIFLDIACIFKGWDKDFVERLLEDCGFFAKSGISRLIDKSLITISNDKLEMHDLVQQMGRDIVCQEGITHPGKRSRLWKSNDIYQVLKNDLGTELIEVIKLDMSRIEDLNLSPTVFMKLYNLRCLQFGNCGANRIKINLPDGLTFLPNKLRYLHWSRYTLKSLPSSFCPMNLLELHLRHSQLEDFWKGIQPLENLKYIDLSKSLELVKILDLSKFPNLEVLRLKGCRNLVEIHSSIQYDSKLFKVDLDGCKNLCTFPSNLDFKNLKAVSVRDCSKITEFPNKVPQSLEKLDFSGTAIKQVMVSIGQFSKLVNLKLESCKKLKSLPNSIGELRCLKELDLGGCSKLEGLPDSICNLQSLKYLTVDDCVNLNRLPHKLGNLESLELLSADRSGIKRLPLSTNQLRKLTHFFLKDCGILQIPRSFGSLVSLTLLNLGGNNFKNLPASIKQLSNLEILL